MTDPENDLDEHQAAVAAAQERDHDPDGDPDALDPGDLNEAPSDVDPPEADQLNHDHDDQLADVDDGQDDGVEDYSTVTDPEQDGDPEPELDTQA